MTKKITKVIAVLGVVAGLGVAALPIGSYAAVTDTTDVTVEVEIEETIGSVAPSCLDDVSGSRHPAGELAESDCPISGSANTGIVISIRDSAAGVNGGANLALTGYTDDFESGNENGAEIPAITAQYPSNGVNGMNQDNTALVNAGGGWGYQFQSGVAALEVVTANVGGTTSESLWNGIKNSNTDVVVAQSSVGVTLSDVQFRFRAVTPDTLPAGFYSDVVTITIATTE